MQWIIIEVGCDGNTLQNCLLEEAGKSLVEKMWAVDVDKPPVHTTVHTTVFM